MSPRIALVHAVPMAVLAHFSTSIAYPFAQQRVKNPVLTSPRSAVIALRDTLTRA